MSYEKNAETLKKFSDECDNRISFLMIQSACKQYEPFTHGGLNSLPHMYLPAIAEVMEEYSDQQNAFNENRISGLNSDVDKVLEARDQVVDELNEAREVIQGLLLGIDHSRFEYRAGNLSALIPKAKSLLNKHT